MKNIGDHFTIREYHVGLTFIRWQGRTWGLTSVLGRIQPSDVGKRIYNVGGILQVENKEQRDKRLAKESII
jgi:hypothetical protein